MAQKHPSPVFGKHLSYRAFTLLKRTDSVVRRFELIVAEPHQHVANVDGDSSWYGVHLCPFALGNAPCQSSVKLSRNTLTGDGGVCS